MNSRMILWLLMWLVVALSLIVGESRGQANVYITLRSSLKKKNKNRRIVVESVSSCVGKDID